ncbi:MAG: FG-GAP-like repeat-containing protein, partial [Planctomycetota bacterium]|nr:FG-GAP-like repeat-containing protein [Planctomycetota bacterium]
MQKYLSIFMKILDGVSFAHAHKVLHRDLKPENIMLGEHGEVLVMDWGLAKAMEAGELKKTGRVSKDSANRRVKSLREAGGEDSVWTMDGDISGTPNYMSPEQADGLTAELGPGSDIFSLGIILYEMLTLKKAFPGGAIQAINKVLKGQYVDPKIAAGKRFVPPELAAVVKKAMAPEIGDRYQTIQDFQDDIEQFISGRAVSARKDPVLTALLKWMKRNPTLTVLGLIVLPLMLFIFAYIFLRPGTLLLNVEQMPVNSVIRVGSEEIVLEAGSPVIERRVWPFIGTEVRAVRGFKEPFLPFEDAPKYTVAVVSDQTVKLTLEPALKVCPLYLTLEGKQGATVSITCETDLPKTIGPMSESLRSKTSTSISLRPRGKKGRLGKVSLVSGRYRLSYSEPGFFDKSRVVNVTNPKGHGEIIDYSKMSTSDYEFASEVLDYQFGDLNFDGYVDLVIARKNHIECYSLKGGRFNLLWSRGFQTAENNARYRRHISVADLDNDGELEVICVTKTQLVRLDGQTGNILGAVDIHDARFRVLPLDRGQVPSLLVGTGYKGIQRFTGRGERLWGCTTARYSAYSPFHQVKLTEKPYSVILAKSVQPFVLYAIRSDTGELLWTKSDLKKGDAKIHVINDVKSPLVLLETGGDLIAIDAEDGRSKWTKDGANFQRLIVTPLKFKGPECILSTTNDRVICYDAAGVKLWEDKIQSYFGRGVVGDIDDDGSYEWICAVNGVSDNVKTNKGKEKGKRKIARTNSFEIRAYSSAGELRRSMRVPAEVRSMRLRPAIVQLEKGAGHLLFVVQKQKCVFYQFGRPKFPNKSGDRLIIKNLDGKGADELIRVRANKFIECTGDVPWKIKLVKDHRIQLNPALSSFGDLNGDGVLDLVGRGFLNTKVESLFVISGKDGEVLFCQSMPENPGQPPLIGPPLSNGKACLVYFGNQNIHVYQLEFDPKKKFRFKERVSKFKTPWQKGDARAYIETNGPPRVMFCHGGGFASLALRERGNIKYLRKVPEPSTHNRILKVGDEYVLTGAVGSVFMVKEDKSLRSNKIFESGISSFVKRKSELIAISEFGEGAVINIADLTVRERFRLKQFRDPKSWILSLHDIDNDQQPELLVHANDGSALILDGRKFKTLHSSVSGFRTDELNEVVSYPAQIADMNGDGKLDLISMIGLGSRIVFDIEGQISNSLTDTTFSADPLLSVSYLRREFLVDVDE